MKFNKAEEIAESSITKKISNGGVTPTSGAFMWIDGDNAAIFNQSVPYERFYTLGKEVSTRHVERGSTTTGDIYTGREYSKADIWNVNGYEKIDAKIKVVSTGYCVSINDAKCSVSTVLKVVGNGTNYLWSVVGGIIVSGQGTTEIQIDTTSNISGTVKVVCDVSNQVDSQLLSRVASYTIAKVEQTDILDRHVTYDSLNIANEFLATSVFDRHVGYNSSNITQEFV